MVKVSIIDRQYATIYSQAESDCGGYLAASTNHGFISIFQTSNILASKENASGELKYTSIIQTHNSPVYAMMTVNDRLITSGRCGEQQYCCSVWKWKNLHIQGKAKCLSTFTVSDIGEINDMTFIQNSNHVILSCGDGLLRQVDLESNTVLRTFQGHSDSVLSVDYCNQKLISSSEDGTVRLWDIRNGQCINILKPFEHMSEIKAKWLSSCRLSNDWLICGGAVPISSWYLGSLNKPATIFDFYSTTQALHFNDGNIHSGGNNGKLSEWTISGELCNSIDVCPKDIYSIHNGSFMTVAGTSFMIDAFSLPTRYSTCRLLTC